MGKGSGNLCEDTTIKFPLNTGTLVVKGMNCPVKAGQIEVDIDVSPLTSGLVSNDLVKISVTAANTAGEDLFCLALTTASTFTEKASCKGTDDFPSTPACYGSNVLGKEDVVLKIEDFSAGAGHLNFAGTGSTPLSCETAFTKDDSNAIAFDNCDVSGYAKVKGAQYCSDTDELKATFNPLEFQSQFRPSSLGSNAPLRSLCEERCLLMVCLHWIQIQCEDAPSFPDGNIDDEPIWSLFNWQLHMPSRP